MACRHSARVSKRLPRSVTHCFLGDQGGRGHIRVKLQVKKQRQGMLP
jgi:hypothetical protein